MVNRLPGTGHVAAQGHMYHRARRAQPSRAVRPGSKHNSLSKGFGIAPSELSMTYFPPRPRTAKPPAPTPPVSTASRQVAHGTRHEQLRGARCRVGLAALPDKSCLTV